MSKKIIKRAILAIIITLVLLVMAYRTYLSEKLNKKFFDTIGYDSERNTYRETIDGVGLTCGKSDPINVTISAGAEETEYIDSEGTEWVIDFDLWIDNWGNYTYALGMGTYGKDESKNLGGQVYVDKNLDFIYEDSDEEKEKEYITGILKDNWDEVIRVVEIANEKWDLGIETGK